MIFGLWPKVDEENGKSSSAEQGPNPAVSGWSKNVLTGDVGRIEERVAISWNNGWKKKEVQ